MEYKKSGSEFLLRLEVGEELLSSLKDLCKKENLTSAFISGIGSARNADLAHYDPERKKYSIKKFKGPLEIVSLNGSISLLENEPALHLHVIFSLHDYSTVGGHLMRAEIRPTCELVIFPLKTKIKRKFDSETGLNLQHYI